MCAWHTTPPAIQHANVQHTKPPNVHVHASAQASVACSLWLHANHQHKYCRACTHRFACSSLHTRACSRYKSLTCLGARQPSFALPEAGAGYNLLEGREGDWWTCTLRTVLYTALTHCSILSYSREGRVQEYHIVLRCTVLHRTVLYYTAL